MVKLVDSLIGGVFVTFFFFSSRRRHTRLVSDWSSDVCSSDLLAVIVVVDHDVNIHNYSEVVWKTLCALDPERSEERRVGKEGRSRGAPDAEKKRKKEKREDEDEVETGEKFEAKNTLQTTEQGR